MAPRAMSRQPGGLRYSSDLAHGHARHRAGRGFVYRDHHGRRIEDAATLERIGKLAIPPAWRDVWICADPRGHLQATGRDARGRKQYRYHPDWRRLRDRDKFGRMRQFGEHLPALRDRLRSDLALEGMPRPRVLALVASLLDCTLARVGNREYLRSNGSHGLATLRARHAGWERGGTARLRFRGKSGRMQDLRVDDDRLVRLLRRCQRLPGQALFQYVDEAGKRHAIDSGMVNRYLRDAMGAAFTAKDFRTWGATRLAVATLAARELPPGESARDAVVVEAIAAVAKALGNTPAVCRASYVHPLVPAAWRGGRLHAKRRPTPRASERLLLALLRKDERSRAKKKTGSERKARRSRQARG
jgi:DNA topoisomerase I